MSLPWRNFMQRLLVFILTLALSETASQAGFLIPTPSYVKYGGTLRDLGRVVVLSSRRGDHTVRAELSQFIFTLTGDAVTESIGEEGLPKADTLIVLDPPTSKRVRGLVKEIDKSIGWSSLGEQGYLLYVGRFHERQLIMMVASTDAGRYYSLQSLKQLMYQVGNRKYLHMATIIDAPSYDLRGVVFGDFRRWFSGPPHTSRGKTRFEGWPYRERAQLLKFNFVWLAGWEDGRKRTVLPLNEKDRASFRSFFLDCARHFITPSVGLRPHFQTPYPSREKGGVVYSSEKDIEGVANNLLALYGLGFRNLYLAFDDIPEGSYLLYNKDRIRFKSLGEAHYYFVTKVYEILKERCSNFVFRVVPTEYYGSKSLTASGRGYLNIMSRLPKEIEFVWSGLSYQNPSADSLEAEKYAVLCKRRIIVWSNFYPATYYGKRGAVPDIVVPFRGGDGDLFRYTTGFFFLPVDQPNEDAAHVSWYTAADYMWRPVEYSAEASLTKALALGSK